MRSQTMVFLCFTVLAVAPAAAQERMYKCIDAKGKTYYTQVPPPECLGRDTQELNKSGSLIRKNPAVIPLTPAQEQAREAERKKKIEEEVGSFRLTGQLPLQNLVHLRRIRLALGRLHYLAHEGVERLFFSGAVVLDLLCVRGEDLVDDFLDRAGIGDLLQSTLFDDLVGAALSVPHQQNHCRCGCV